MDTTSTPRKKLLLMQQFLSLLLIFRLQISDLNPYIYWLTLLAFFIGKYAKEGNTVGSVLQYVSAFIIGLGDLWASQDLGQAGVVLAVLNYIFVAPTLYTLPDYRPKVGLRDTYAKRNNKVLYYAEFYPVQQNEAPGSSNQLYQIPWNHGLQLNKMAEYIGIKNKVMFALFKFFNSSAQRFKLTFSKGSEAPHRGVILFSHGRTGTPFTYSSILKNLAREWKIFSPQHSEVKETPYKDMSEIKRYREVQVKQRADEIVYMASKVPQNEEIVLMGHSYGGATVIQAYHSLHLSIRKRVSHIILLDPWLFPLTDQMFNDEIVCPVLMLANQHFLSTQDIYKRNKKFVERHGSKLLYFCWRGADHLHQTDMPFIVGTSLRRIKNAKDGARQQELNMQAIHMFLDFKKVGVEQIEKIHAEFGQDDMGIEYKPTKWKDNLNF